MAAFQSRGSGRLQPCHERILEASQAQRRHFSKMSLAHRTWETSRALAAAAAPAAAEAKCEMGTTETLISGTAALQLRGRSSELPAAAKRADGSRADPDQELLV